MKSIKTRLSILSFLEFAVWEATLYHWEYT